MFASLLEGFKREGLNGKLTVGVVVDNNDPSKLQRVKYRIAGLHSGRADNELVWAIPLGWGAQGNAPGGIGSISIPPIGAKVIIFFPEDDEHDSYYFADFHDESTKISELLEDYPNSYGYVDAAGNLLLVNTLQKTVRFIHVTGSFIRINANGSIDCGSIGRLAVYAATTLHLRAETAINIDAPIINLRSGAATTLTPTPRTPPTPGSFSGKVDY